MTPSTYLERAAAIGRRHRALGWSQNELARRVGRNRGKFSAIISGRMISHPALEAAERVLNREERRRGRRV